jgi:hypothetical protein
MRKRRLMDCLLSWLAFSFPFLALTAPAWLPLRWLAAVLVILGLLFIAWLDVCFVLQLVGSIRRHRMRKSSGIALGGDVENAP